MTRNWILMSVLLGILVGCSEPQFVTDIESRARDYLCSVTIRCYLFDNHTSSAAIIDGGWVVTQNKCADRIGMEILRAAGEEDVGRVDRIDSFLWTITYNKRRYLMDWGVVTSATDGTEYDVESVAAHNLLTNLAILKVQRFGKWTVPADIKKVRKGDKIYIAASRGPNRMISAITEITYLSRDDDVYMFFDTPEPFRNTDGWGAGVALNYEGDLIGIIFPSGMFSRKSGRIEPIEDLRSVVRHIRTRHRRLK